MLLVGARSPLLAPALAAAMLSLASTARAQDFDPHGRHHASSPPPHTAAGHPAPAGHAAPEAETGPAQAQLIQRYTHIVLSQPGAAFPLQRLAQLYRDRDGNIVALIKDFESRSAQAGADQYAASVALAGLYKVDGRSQDAVAAYEYRCRDCDDVFTVHRPMSDVATLTRCPAGHERVVRVWSAVSVSGVAAAPRSAGGACCGGGCCT